MSSASLGVRSRRASATVFHGRAQAVMIVGDDQLDTTQAPISQRAQEALPEGLRLGRGGGNTGHLAPTIGVDAHSDYRRPWTRYNLPPRAVTSVASIQTYGHSPSSGLARRASMRHPCAGLHLGFHRPV